MQGIKEYGQFIITSAGGALLWLFGAWDIALQVLIGLIIADYITGLMAASLNKSLSSKVGLRGIYKKVGILICVSVAVLTDKLIGTENTLRIAIICCFCGNEGISIMENLARLGVPIPQKLIDALAQLRGKGTGEENENI